ncbi:RND superfamily putative drug exporter [Leucobacter luti]|uniref:MMPL family transporter n=1 Tax=Leucobacter luti TaxID=340320 RepID=UPI0010D0C233|nr:MMPL family transporter [Leucobacter luti]MCW2289073.1 RND superfamily putative drug exporter [Leucobacter luti]TCK35526.1 RND superfamily putative drug exporter [Leucobacter luti]
MALTPARRRFSDRLTSRSGAWISLGIVVMILVGLFGAFSSAQAPARSASAPVNSESTHVSELLEQFPGADRQSVLVVATRDDGAQLSDTDLEALDSLRSVLDDTGAAQASGPLLSEDGAAALLVAPIIVGEDNTETSATIEGIREAIAQAQPAGLHLQVTGGPAFGADIAASFSGANFTLLIVTMLIVALLLIITYRSPVLWLVPLIVVALADGLAGRITAAAGSAWDLQFDAGIISVLVFGAGANYALLLISRYREELLLSEDHRVALSIAWRKTAPAILASNVTVVLALLTLVLAAIPGTHGLGVASALGLVVALAAVLFALPPLLAVCGRKLFWPFVPRPGSSRPQGRVWRAVAERVMRRPLVSLLAGLAVLSVMATGLFGTAVGLDQTAKFRVESESAAGLNTLSEHFPAGEAQPIWVVTNSAAAPQVLAALERVPGIVRAHPAGTTAGPDSGSVPDASSLPSAGSMPSAGVAPGTGSDGGPEAEMEAGSGSSRSQPGAESGSGSGSGSGAESESEAGSGGTEGLTKIMVTSEFVPSTPESLAQITAIRAAVHTVPGADARVGGAVATDVDARNGNARDMLLIAPLVLLVSFVVLTILLRSLIAPILLLLVNLASAVAAIGAGAWVSRMLFGQHALDLQVPLLAFLFLIALGIDYTIFLVHRAKSEVASSGTRAGMVEAITHTGGVITSAGIVLAGVFAALGVLPLVTLGQLGLIVGIGVLVDTLVVRTVIVPALFGILGDRIWWPTRVPEPLRP